MVLCLAVPRTGADGFPVRPELTTLVDAGARDRADRLVAHAVLGREQREMSAAGRADCLPCGIGHRCSGDLIGDVWLAFGVDPGTGAAGSEARAEASRRPDARRFRREFYDESSRRMKMRMSEYGLPCLFVRLQRYP
jgi:hypothetical protein